MNRTSLSSLWGCGLVVCWLGWTWSAPPDRARGLAAEPVGRRTVDASPGDDDGDIARKADLLHSPDWQRAVAELGGWLATQSVYPPAEVRRIKVQFNQQVAAMSSYELEYLLDSISAKLRLLDTAQARDATAWLGEYLSAMSDARRARALQNVPDIFAMSSEQLWREIQRIDSLRNTLQERQEGVDARQAALVAKASAGRESTAAASRAAAARARAAPSHSPYRSGVGSPPFSDYQPRRMQIVVGGMF